MVRRNTTARSKERTLKLPQAWKIQTGDARVPRTVFGHAHESGSATFPPQINFGDTARMHILMPDNWNGLDALILWLSGADTEQKTLNITVNLGTCGENQNTHTQTVNGLTPTITADKYLCLDLTVTFATVLANLAARDMIQVLVYQAAGDNYTEVFGIEAQET